MPRSPSPPTSPHSGSRSGSLSPTQRRRRSNAAPPGFLPSPKPKQTPISEMSVWELQNRYNRNSKILASPDASSSTYAHRLSVEQAAIQEQLVEVHGMEDINIGLKNTFISSKGNHNGGQGDVSMDVEMKQEAPLSKAIDAKKRALARFGASAGPSHIGMLGMDEAIEIEQRAHAQDLQRKQRMEEKRLQHGYPLPHEVMSKEEREARIWAFMNYKPSESDLEDAEDDDDDDDPAGWFEDDQDDGRKGQDLVEPDEEDPSSFHNIIRVMDPNQMHYNTFYEPRDDGD
ncbi:hypothetical protein BDP27DRAFT_1211633 [Rhodocollybia butyracea]|uniref:Uncharacterized protein n=1 Tax=Rhodocollybia butyracea TaxID=206335 RepID=A0A9P5Q927_9AGAR|nr:hypothetical protein BDP27DRAFT_1211633 [Rhodocollybia butyracea]